MPIEIKELNIRVSVSQNQQEQDSSPASGSSGNALPDKDELIAECIEQVMELMKMKDNR